MAIDNQSYSLCVEVDANHIKKAERYLTDAAKRADCSKKTFEKEEKVGIFELGRAVLWS